MSITLNAATRTEVGKRVKQVRTSGNVPGIIYGHGVEPRAISFGMSEFQKVYRTAGTSSLVDVSIDKKDSVKALIQEVQVHHLTMRPNHVDLREIRMDEELTVKVPVIFDGEAPAVKELAGTLNRPLDELTVRCLPANLPHGLHVDLSTLKTFDDVLTIADVKLPAGVTVVEETTTTIASVMAPMTDEQLKKLEEQSQGDVTAVKTEAEVKKAEEEAKEKEAAAAEEAPKA